MRKLLVCLSAFTALILGVSIAIASEIYVGDSAGNIGVVDTDSGVVSGLFNPVGVGAFTDIALAPNGNLYGITFTSLYSIDIAAGTATFIGNNGATNLNALVIANDGTACAMGPTSNNLFTIDLGTGIATSIGSTGFYSDGDLQFDYMGNLYLAGSTTPNGGDSTSKLFLIDTANPASSSLVGDIGIDDVYGLSFANGKMFGAAGTDVFEIDLATGAQVIGTTVSFAGQGMVVAWGASNTVIAVATDIKPGSCPNPLNVKSQGVIPVAILGTDSFDAATVDPATVRLEGVAPLRWALADVTTPFEPFLGKVDCLIDCDELYGDGILDLVLNFDTQEVVGALESVSDRDCVLVTLTGELIGGTPIEGEDVMVILNKGNHSPCRR